MNFFEHQDQARQNTKWLVGLFALSVLCIILMVYGAALFSFGMGARSRARLGLWHPGLFWTVAIPTVVVIGVGSLYKLMVLSWCSVRVVALLPKKWAGG